MTYIRTGSCVRMCRLMRTYVQTDTYIRADRCLRAHLKINSRYWMMQKDLDVFREHQGLFSGWMLSGRHTGLPWIPHIHHRNPPTQTNKKTVQRRLSRVPSRWLRLFPIWFTINRLIINIMTSNFGTTGTRARLYEILTPDFCWYEYIYCCLSVCSWFVKRTSSFYGIWIIITWIISVGNEFIVSLNRCLNDL